MPTKEIIETKRKMNKITKDIEVTFISIIESRKYPEEFKKVYEPPFIIFGNFKGEYIEFSDFLKFLSIKEIALQ